MATEADRGSFPSHHRQRFFLVSRSIEGLHPKGGMEHFCAEFAKELNLRGVEVCVITSEASEFAPYAELPCKIVQLPWRWRSWPRSVSFALSYASWRRSLWCWLAKNASLNDVVYLNGATGAPKRAFPTRGLVVMHNPHGMEEFFKTSLQRWIGTLPSRLASRRAACYADKVIATDDSLVGPIQRNLRVDVDKVVVLPNAVNMRKNRLNAAEGEASLPECSARCLLVSVGRLAWNKGFDLVPQALNVLRRSGFSDVAWHHYCPNEEGLVALQALVDIYAPGQGLIFVGASDQVVQAALAHATMVLVPSRHEGSSLVALEALSHGTPVIACDVGSLRDKIIPGETGVLISPNSQDLAKGIEFLLREPDLLEKCIRNGPPLIEREFNFSMQVTKLLNVIEGLGQHESGDREP